MPIYWDQFTWEAFASLTTGAAAVAGAVLVGLRQVAITNRQTSILERQTSLEEVKIRVDLHERRMAVYDTAGSYLAAALREARPPSTDIDRKFQNARSDATFLFGPRVNGELKAIFTTMIRYEAAWKAIDRTRNTSNADDNDREHSLFEALERHYAGLATLFSEEMSLGSSYRQL